MGKCLYKPHNYIKLKNEFIVLEGNYYQKKEYIIILMKDT